MLTLCDITLIRWLFIKVLHYNVSYWLLYKWCPTFIAAYSPNTVHGQYTYTMSTYFYLPYDQTDVTG